MRADVGVLDCDARHLVQSRDVANAGIGLYERERAVYHNDIAGHLEVRLENAED
jgi:hypothetical protein